VPSWLTQGNFLNSIVNSSPSRVYFLRTDHPARQPGGRLTRFRTNAKFLPGCHDFKRTCPLCARPSKRAIAMGSEEDRSVIDDFPLHPLDLSRTSHRNDPYAGRNARKWVDRAARRTHIATTSNGRWDAMAKEPDKLG